MVLTIEMKMIGLWILWFVAMTVHHFFIKDMIKNELKKLEEKLSTK